MKKGQSLAQQHKHARQESLRELLSKQGHLQHIIDMVDKIRDLDQHLDNDHHSRLKTAIDTKMKLINKYLPDLKAVDLNVAGDEDHPLIVEVRRTIVDSKHTDS